VALAACAAAVSVAATVRDGRLEWFPPPASQAARSAVPATPVDALIAEHPPVTGTLILLSRQPAHWTTVAWATRGGAVCWATYRAPMQGATSEVECPAWPRGDVPVAGGGAGLSPLLPGIFPPGPGRLVPEVGLATPRAARVTVTFFGSKFSAAVLPVPLGGGKSVGVYLIWLRLPRGVSNYGGADTGPATAYDSAGRVVARHGPGM
jgi:hypothetical protein